MAEEIGFENGRNSNCQGLVTLTLTLDPAIRHTVVHHSSTSTYIPNFIEIEENFCGRTDGRTDGRTFFPLILLGRLLEVDLIIIIITIKRLLSSCQSHLVTKLHSLLIRSFPIVLRESTFRWTVNTYTTCQYMVNTPCTDRPFSGLAVFDFRQL